MKKLSLTQAQLNTLRQNGVAHNVVKTDVDTTTVFQPGPVLVAMSIPNTTLLLDEIDQGRASALMVLQQILQNKSFYIKKTGKVVDPAPGFKIIATANTKGNGENSHRYAGAQIMNEALVERFSVSLDVAYPSENIETKILSGYTKDKKFIKKLVLIAKQTRIAEEAGDLEACLTTRRLCQIAQNYAIFGDQKVAFELGVNKFNQETKDALMEIFSKLSVVEDDTPVVKKEDDEEYFIV